MRGRHVWPGLAAYRVADGGASAFSVDEILNQVRLTRMRGAAGGHLLYNTTSTLKRQSGAVAAALAADMYETRAILPASGWLDATPPAMPNIVVAGGAAETLSLTPVAGDLPRWWVVRSRTSGGWVTRVLFGDERSTSLSTLRLECLARCGYQG